MAKKRKPFQWRVPKRWTNPDATNGRQASTYTHLRGERTPPRSGGCSCGVQLARLLNASLFKNPLQKGRIHEYIITHGEASHMMCSTHFTNDRFVILVRSGALGSSIQKHISCGKRHNAAGSQLSVGPVPFFYLHHPLMTMMPMLMLMLCSHEPTPEGSLVVYCMISTSWGIAVWMDLLVVKGVHGQREVQ